MACSLQSPSSKHPRQSSELEHRSGIDHISNLPDSVLCHILSFLPTEDAVATTILSKRWVDLWTRIPVLDFSFPGHHLFRTNSSFVNFVFNVLLMSKAQSTPKFSLDWSSNSELDVGYLRTWISAAVRHNVQELSLNFLFSGRYLDLCGCLFACKTLVSLKLGVMIFVNVPANIHFPCLKILHLLTVKYANDDSLRRLISSSPVLEDLTVERIQGDNIVVLDINVPSLKRITVVRCACRFHFGEIDPRCKLLINAPLLEKIDLKGEGYSDFQIEDASNLVELHERKCDQALVGSVPKCVSMRLKSFYFREISTNHCDWTVPRYFLANAKFLKQMKIGISFCLSNRRRLLRNLLKYPRASVACEIGFFLKSTNEEIHFGPNAA